MRHDGLTSEETTSEVFPRWTAFWNLSLSSVALMREVACLRVEPVALLRGHLPERRVYNLL